MYNKTTWIPMLGTFPSARKITFCSIVAIWVCSYSRRCWLIFKNPRFSGVRSRDIQLFNPISHLLFYSNIKRLLNVINRCVTFEENQIYLNLKNHNKKVETMWGNLKKGENLGEKKENLIFINSHISKFD